MNASVEIWLRGPLENIPPLLQPAAHALLQARDEINAMMQDFPENLLWKQPAGLASPAFHLQHIVGVVNRLFTYAHKQMLSEEQLTYLAAEGKQFAGLQVSTLVEKLNIAIDEAVNQIKSTDPNSLDEARTVGRAQLPSTVIGLIFHAAEHTMRHTGQLLVTCAVLKAG